MKYLYYSILLFLFINTAYPQSLSRSGSASNPFGTCQPVRIQLTPDKGERGLFNHFEVIDARPDTARIGVHRDRHKANHSFYRQLVLAGAASDDIAAYLNTSFSNPRGIYSAMVVIRALWLSDANCSREGLMKDPGRGFEKTQIRIKAEVYAARDSVYVPLLRFDSLEISKKSSYSWYGEALSGLLAYLACSAADEADKKWQSGKRLRLEEISQFNQSRFEMAITRDQTLSKGVYSNFDEFRNNAPSIKEYELKREDGRMILYIKDAGRKSYYSHNAWGYCDGTSIFIMRDGTLCPAWREGNAYYLYGNADFGELLTISEHPSVGAGISPVGPTSSGIGLLAGLSAGAMVNSLVRSAGKNQRRILTIDMDTGIQY